MGAYGNCMCTVYRSGEGDEIGAAVLGVVFGVFPFIGVAYTVWHVCKVRERNGCK
jgi:hypothetical protein